MANSQQKTGFGHLLVYFTDLPPQRIPLTELELPVFWPQEQAGGNSGHYAVESDYTLSAIAQSISCTGSYD